jgi:hypothetical protein
MGKMQCNGFEIKKIYRVFEISYNGFFALAKGRMDAKW